MQAPPQLSTTPPQPGVVTFPAINNAFQTIATDFSGDTDPAALAWPFSKWADTSTGLLKRRNAAGTEWVVVGSLLRRPLDAYAGGEIPTTDQGPVFVSGQGTMEWSGTRYVVTNGDHGQCEFIYVNPTECRLMPRDGDGLIINGRQYRIDPAGVPLNIADVTAAAGSTNYVYAKDAGAGGFVLEASTTGHSRHTDGVRIKTGDPTRTLVGMAFKNSSGQFQFDGSIPGVASWFNRYYPVGTGSDVNRSTVSNTPVPLIPGSNVWVWEGESVDLQANGFVSNNTAGGTCWLQLNLDGSQAWVGGHTSSTANATGSVAPRASTQKGELSEGFHFVEMLVSVSPGSSGTFTLSQTIRANP